MRKLKRLIKWLAFWWCFAGVAVVTGCVTDEPMSEPKYPEYNKWWTGDSPKRSHDLRDLGQGDILVFDNGMEAVLL